MQVTCLVPSRVAARLHCTWPLYLEQNQNPKTMPWESKLFLCSGGLGEAGCFPWPMENTWVNGSGILVSPCQHLPNTSKQSDCCMASLLVRHKYSQIMKLWWPCYKAMQMCTYSPHVMSTPSIAPASTCLIHTLAWWNTVQQTLDA